MHGQIRKGIGLIVLVVFVAIQFIRPARNSNRQVLSTDITNTFSVPDTVLQTLKAACYDCHSNNTNYPWYTNIQPVGWVMAYHITQGMQNLNFSEFGSYSKRKQSNKLKSISESVNERSMPPPSYTLMHTSAKLSDAQKKTIMAWALWIKDSMTSR